MSQLPIAQKTSKKTIGTPHVPKEKQLEEKLLGVWTDGSTQNASFLIEKNHSITYIDDGNDYTYSLHGDSITIKSADTIYKEKVSFKADTLILSDKNQQLKFWKFKD